jgi:penicillin-binding protein 2
VAYAPADNPQIAIAVLLESGAWGASDAGPIVRRMLDTWLAAHDGVLVGAQRLATPPAAAAPAAVVAQTAADPSRPAPSASPTPPAVDADATPADVPAQSSSGARP